MQRFAACGRLPDLTATKVTDSYTCGGNWPVIEFGDIRIFYERGWEPSDRCPRTRSEYTRRAGDDPEQVTPQGTC
jgi:hypothetical protein